MNEHQVASQAIASVIISGFIGYSLELLKKSSWFPWLTMETKKANRIVAMIVAFLAAIGIHFQYDGSAGTLLISGLTLMSLRHGLWEYSKQLVIQQLIYDGVINKEGK